MSSKMVTGIQEMTISAATYHSEIINPTYVNFFFGNNGVGKTTISREIAKMRRAANIVSEGYEPEDVVFESGKTHLDYNFLVYNQDFIRDNFWQLEHLPGVFMIDEESIKQEEEINAKKREKEKVDKECNDLSWKASTKGFEMSDLLTSLEDECWDIAKPIRARFPEMHRGKFRSKKILLAQIKTISNPVEHDFTELETLYDTAYDQNARTYNRFVRVPDCEVMEKIPGLELLGKRIVSSSDTDFSRFITALNATDWVHRGHEQFKSVAGAKCPYCQQSLPATFEKDLADCFDEEYKREIKALEVLLKSYKDAGNALWTRFRDNLRDVMPKIDTTEYRDKMEIIKGIIFSNIQAIERKIKEASSEVTLESVTGYLEDINKLIDEFNVKVQENNEIVSAIQVKKTECVDKIWEYLAWKTKPSIQKYNSVIKGHQKEYSELETKINDKKEYLKKLAEEIESMSQHTVNTEDAIANMNKMLKDSGFQGFHIQKHPDYNNQYQIVREDNTVAKQLSEGERNFIAFLYFCSLVHGEGSTGDAQTMYTDKGEELITDGRDTRDKIVVIDDPVSSMDSSALFIVSSLVRRMINICKNNVTLGEKTEKGDYIKQMFILTHNPYFHREITVNQEKFFSTVSFYLITKCDNCSNIKLCITKNNEIPTEKKNYNPVQNSYATLWLEYNEVQSSITLKNVIRRILEYYFIQICGYDGQTLQDIILIKNRHRFVKQIPGTEDEDASELRTVSSMIDYLTSDSFGVNDGLYYVDDSIPTEIYKDLTKRIFEAMGQPQHYQMMSTISVNH